MERIIEILEDIKGGIDYSSENKLIDDRLLDSLAIITLVAELEDEFDIIIPPVEIIAENFNSVEAMMYMVNRLASE